MQYTLEASLLWHCWLPEHRRHLSDASPFLFAVQERRPAYVGHARLSVSPKILLYLVAFLGLSRETVTRTIFIWHREHEWDSEPGAEKLWDNLVPGGTGVILIKDPAQVRSPARARNGS